MKRILEAQLMEDEDQVKAYAEADFEEPHGHFIKLFEADFLDREVEGFVLDLGCGPGDISFRFAASFGNCAIHAVDGSTTMLKYARHRLGRTNSMHKQINFFEGMLPHLRLPESRYDYLISNSLLHHLPDPDVLWTVIKQYSKTDSGIFIMDLLRPENTGTAQRMVESYAVNEPEVLRRDFYNSLLAAFTLEEIADQLRKHDLDYLTLKQVSDRHLSVSGRIA
ncbi:MAG: class I SAM-dependent methyltransferase [Methylococcaceae bacterium]|nr:class I SAM-dependent methyltransferase [Methylococcaceae bacterium]